MKNQKSVYFLLSGILLVCFACNPQDENPSTAIKDDCLTVASANNGQVVEGQYIIAYKPESVSGVSTSRIAEKSNSLLKRNNIAESKIQYSFIGEPEGFVAKLSEKEANQLRQDPTIALVEPDRIVSICACWQVVQPRTIQWGVNRVGYGDGTGKTAWIIDTGIDLEHPDLKVDVSRSRSFITGQTSADDNNGHGTHVAGVIGALNNQIGTLGVASGANLVSLKVLDQLGEGLLSNVIAAVGHIRRNAKAGDVVNMSLGAEGTSQILDNEIQAAANQGIFFAIAAGNDGEPARNYSPARTNGRHIYTISAIDSLGNFAKFSNYGTDIVDFVAPGVRIVSTYSDGRYARLSGTSMATPHAAGILLLNNGVINRRGAVTNLTENVSYSEASVNGLSF